MRRTKQALLNVVCVFAKHIQFDRFASHTMVLGRIEISMHFYLYLLSTQPRSQALSSMRRCVFPPRLRIEERAWKRGCFQQCFQSDAFSINMLSRIEIPPHPARAHPMMLRISLIYFIHSVHVYVLFNKRAGVLYRI